MFAIELNASKDCAREIRGTLSIAITLISFSANFSSNGAFCAGQIKLIKVEPFLSKAISSSRGALTFKIMSDCQIF